MKNLGQVIAIALAGSLSTGIALAAPSAALKNLCAITSTLTCDLTGCVRGPANAVNLPVFVEIDTENKVVETAQEGGDHRTSKILGSHAEGDTLVLLVDELGRAGKGAGAVGNLLFGEIRRSR